MNNINAETDYQTALEDLFHRMMGRWPLPSDSPGDLCREIETAFTRQRENAIESAFVDYGMDPNDVRRLF
jgi:hypothetical protein